MKIAFAMADDDPRSPARQLSEVVKEFAGKDAEIVLQPLGAPLVPADGLWIFTEEEDGGCPEALRGFLERNAESAVRIPVTVTGVGGKDGAMNAVAEITEIIEAHGGTVAEEEPLLLPLRTQKLVLDPEERLDVFWHTDDFLTVVEKRLG